MSKTVQPIASRKIAKAITSLTATLEDGSTFPVPFGVVAGDVVIFDLDGTNPAFLSGADLGEHFETIP